MKIVAEQDVKVGIAGALCSIASPLPRTFPDPVLQARLFASDPADFLRDQAQHFGAHAPR
jgi:hypothetical protein